MERRNRNGGRVGVPGDAAADDRAVGGGFRDDRRAGAGAAEPGAAAGAVRRDRLVGGGAGERERRVQLLCLVIE